MAATISEILVLIAGIAICLISAWGIFAPQRLLQWVKGAMDADWGIYSAVIVRLVLGVTLLYAAPASRFPLVFRILGWIAIVAAVAIVFIGKERLRKFVNWWLERAFPPFIRAWLLFGLAFGGFLIYGVW